MITIEGYRRISAFCNAHDHLELNHYPRTKFRERYTSAHDWGQDVNARLDTEPFRSLRAFSFWDKAFIGGLKNLLCGATEVIHHGEPRPELFRSNFPVRVRRLYGWAHSLHFTTATAIQSAFQKTPPNIPFFIHLAEGTDERAQGEYQTLKRLGCVKRNTVLIHGVGMTDSDIQDAVSEGCTLVTCPTTNHFLLDKTANIQAWQGRVWIGSDSRLTADGDLLAERQALAAQSSHIAPLVASATDCLYIDANQDEWSLRRVDIALIIKDHVPQIGDPHLMQRFPKVQTVDVLLDGIPKRMNRSLARMIQQCKLKEVGLEIDMIPPRKFWLM